jgi:hypothetical protein
MQVKPIPKAEFFSMHCKQGKLTPSEEVRFSNEQ